MKLVEMGCYASAVDVRAVARQVVLAFRQWTSTTSVLQLTNAVRSFARHLLGQGVFSLWILQILFNRDFRLEVLSRPRTVLL